MTRLRILLTVLLGGSSGLAFGPVFGGLGSRFLVAIVAAGGTAAVVTLAASLAPRVPPTVVAFGGLVAICLVDAVVTHTGRSIVDGPRQLLEAAVPADAAGPPLAAVVCLAGWTTLAAGLLALHSTSPIPPLLPPVACLITALGLGAAAGPPPTWLGLTVLGLSIGVLATHRAAAPSLPRLASIATVAAVAVLAAAFLAPNAPGVGRRAPADARTLVDAPVRPRSGISPLQQYQALRDGTIPVGLRGTTSAPVDRLRFASLTQFDGRYWTIDGTYRHAGTVLPTPTGPSGRAVQVTQHVQVTAGTLDWLPTAGRATRVDRSGLGVDETTGDLVVPAGQELPAAYTADSTVVRYDPDDVRAADPAPRPEPLDFVMPDRLAAFARAATAGEAPGTAQLLALYHRLTETGSFQYDRSEDAQGGNGLAQIQRTLLTTRRGTSEQYASAYAVLVRYLGYDARVVMGFRLTHAPQRPTDFTTTGSDIDAWVEVRFAGLGWVTFDPSPRANPVGTTADPPPSANAGGPAADDARAAADAQADTARALPPEVEQPTPSTRSRPSFLRRAALAVAFALTVAIALALLAIPTAKLVRRRRRRHASSPRAAVVGAWRDTVDRLRDASLPIRPSTTSGEIVELTSRSPHPPTSVLAPLRALAHLADQAAYAPEEPPPSLALEAWMSADQIRRQLRSSTRRVRRLRSHLDPRVFFER